MMVRCRTFLKFQTRLFAILGSISRWFAKLSTYRIHCPANGNIFLKSHQSNKRSEVQILQRKVTASIQHPLEGVCQVRNWSICLWPPLYSSVCFIHRCYVKRSIKWGFSDQKTQIIKNMYLGNSIDRKISFKFPFPWRNPVEWGVQIE